LEGAKTTDDTEIVEIINVVIVDNPPINDEEILEGI